MLYRIRFNLKDGGEGCFCLNVENHRMVENCDVISVKLVFTGQQRLELGFGEESVDSIKAFTESAG